MAVLKYGYYSGCNGVIAVHIELLDIDWSTVSDGPPLDLPNLGEVILAFDRQVNLFVGPNASGKSTILRTIRTMHSVAIGVESAPIIRGETGTITNVPAREESAGNLYLNYFNVNPDRPLVILRASDDWPRDARGVKWGNIPLLYIPATRIHLAGTHVFGKSLEMPFDKGLALAAGRPLFDWSFELFIGPFVKSLIDHTPEVFNLNARERRQFEKAVQVVGYSCAKSISAEVVHGVSPQTYVETDEEELDLEVVLQRHYSMGIVTSDDILGEPLYAGVLSSGTQGTLLWIWALAIKMAHHYNWIEGWEKKPAILLIDEIENHLHPTWQRRVIPALLEYFPGLQIFATTHSPFVVAGLKAGQVHLLKRDENGVVTATTNEEDVIGWTADEILRNMMGVDEPTDQLTVDRANRLRQLREKDRLTDEEESELNELRRQVNEDLLSKSGPLEAQRERYGELMERFLLSRQSELTQDGD